MEQYNITYINNVMAQNAYARKPMTLQGLINIFSEPYDDFFAGHMEKIGYKSLLERYRSSAIENALLGEWEPLTTYWSNLAFFHHTVYDKKEIDVLDFLRIADYSKEPLIKSDFKGLERMPNEVFDSIRKSAVKGVYSLFKELNPAFIFGRFDVLSKNIGLEGMSQHSGLMALDIDLDLTDNSKVLDLISSQFHVFAKLLSPSMTLRPVLLLDFSDEHLYEFAKWREPNISFDRIKDRRNSLIKLYHEILFNKVQDAFKDELVDCVGGSQFLRFDDACKNPNRAWFIGRSRRAENQILPNPQFVRLTQKDCVDFGGKHSLSFRPRNMEFDALFD